MGNPFEVPSVNKNENQESVPKVEIRLHLMRHDIREATGEALPEEIEQGIDPDNRTPLTAEGIWNAAALGRDDVDLSRARAMGSARIRSGHTAGLHMVGGREEIEGTENRDELEDVIRQLGGGNIRTDERLNFRDDKSAPLGRYLDEAYFAKTYLKTIVEESDSFAREHGGEYQSTYTGKAAQVASLVDTYFKAASRLRQVSEGVQAAQAEKYEGMLASHGEDFLQSSAPFERFMGSHQGIPESFLLKVVEITQGIEARNELLTQIGNAGFGYSEGFDIKITEQNNEVNGELVYINPRNNKESRIFLTRQTLESIMDEAREMGVPEAKKGIIEKKS